MYVSDSEKNEEYWAKRVKNNVAARRSREARRLKENQVRIIQISLAEMTR
jgi:leukemia factor-related protein